MSAKLGKTSSIITPSTDLILPGKDQKKELERIEKANREKQAAVEAYNEAIFNIDEKLSGKKFCNNRVIVRLFKDDYIDKRIENAQNPLLSGTAVKKESKIQLESDGGKLHIIDNPMPFLLKGVVVAFDEGILDRTTDNVLKDNLKIGAVVEIEPISLQQTIYYLDKSDVDSPMQANEIIAGANPYQKHEGYFEISAAHIECFINHKDNG
jgi:hypothetical protein